MVPDVSKKDSKKDSNSWVYGSVITMATLSLALEGLYEWFTYNYTKAALIEIFSYVGLLQMEIPASCASAVLVALDAAANLTLFSPKEEAQTWSETLPDGYMKGMIGYIKAKFTEPVENSKFSPAMNGLLTFLLPAMGMAISFPVGAYADIEPLQPYLDNLGYYQYLVTVSVLAIGTSYYILSQAGDALSGMDFYLNQGDRRLDPPQKTLLSMLREDPSSVIQCLIEQSSSTVNRAIGFAFLAGRMAEQRDYPDSVTTFAQVVGFIAAVLAFHPGRAPKSYEKYFGKKDARLDLVTQAERDQVYADKYGNMSWPAFLRKEATRVINPLALAETGLAGYLGVALGDAINGLIDYKPLDANDPDHVSLHTSDWVKFIIPVLLGVIAAGLTYVGVYRRADLSRELNQASLDKAKNININNAESEEEKIGKVALFLGALFSLGTWIARTLVSIPSTMGIHVVDRLRETDQLVLATTTSVVPAANGYDYYRDKCAEVVDGYFASVKNGMSFWCQKAQTGERTPLLPPRKLSA